MDESKIFKTAVVATVLLVLKVYSYPTDEGFLEDTDQPASFSDPSDLQQEGMLSLNSAIKNKNCFHFYVSRNMSSLLSDATKMLQNVRDRREREWILTFIYRIKSLAEHLRTHPEARNYECLSSEDNDQLNSSPLDDPLRLQQQELYFVDDTQPMKRGMEHAANLENNGNPEPNNFEGIGEGPPMPKSSDPSIEQEAGKSTQSGPDNDRESVQPLISSQIIRVEENTANPDHSEQSVVRHQGGNPFDNVIVLSSPPDCDAKKKCDELLSNQQAAADAQEDDVLVQQLHAGHTNSAEEEQEHEEILKERIRKALLEEIAPELKKFRTVGGSQEDLMKIWKESGTGDGEGEESRMDADFDYEENGAAAGDLSLNDRFSTSDPTVAPSLRDLRNSQRISTSKSYEPYDDSDVLVKQLFDVRFELPPSKTTQSMDDQQEYLIASTHSPY